MITEDAFRVSPDLLGLPLASPGRRMAAILIDLICIGLLTIVTRSFALVFGIVVAAILVRVGLRRAGANGSVLDRARGVSIGCLGLVVGLVTVGVGTAVLFDRGGTEGDSGSVVIDTGPRVADAQPNTLPADPIESRDAQAVRDGVRLYTVEQALETYAALRRGDGTDAMDRELLRALETRLASEVASDTLAALEAHIAALDVEARGMRRRLERAENDLDDALSRGILRRLAGLVDELGFGFGWAALYMTVLLSVTQGQTLGKRLLGIRVLRLDGQPINWWVAFERAGGYAAGFATGLLGFAQIYWDSNRQAIHDRIVGTVVVRDGAEKLLDWESTL